MNQFETFTLPDEFEGYVYSWNDGDFESGEEVSAEGEYEIGESTGVVTSYAKALEVLSFYPNPAVDVIHVNGNETTSITH